MKKIVLCVLMLFILSGCFKVDRIQTDRAILSFNIYSFETDEEMDGYIAAYGDLPPEFVILVFDAPIRMTRDFIGNTLNSDTQSMTIPKQRIGDPWSYEVVRQMLENMYDLQDSDHENAYIFFLTNGLAVDVDFLENGDVVLSIGRNLRQVQGLIYVMPYGTTTWEENFQWYRNVCRSCSPLTINENAFRFTFEGKHFLFTKHQNGVFEVTPYTP